MCCLISEGLARITQCVGLTCFVKTRWKSLKTLGLTDFSEERFKNAIVVKKKIVYFGSNMRRATYVMEQENKEQGN